MILSSFPVVLLFILSLTGFLSSESLKCSYSKRYAENGAQSYFYTAAVCAVAAVCALALSGFRLVFSPFSVLLGLLFGLAVMGNIVASSLAIRIGPWSYTTVMVSLGIVIPSFSGAVFFNETLSWLDFVGLGFMIVCFICSVKKDPNEKKSSLGWLILSVVAMLSISIVGLLQKTHQSSAHKDEIGVFLTVAFLTSALLSALVFLFARRGAKKEESAKGGRFSALPILLGAGAATAVNHSINLYLSGALDSVVFFPVMCGGELIGVTLISVLLFKEKLTPVQWFGLASGAFASLLLCI